MAYFAQCFFGDLTTWQGHVLPTIYYFSKWKCQSPGRWQRAFYCFGLASSLLHRIRLGWGDCNQSTPGPRLRTSVNLDYGIIRIILLFSYWTSSAGRQSLEDWMHTRPRDMQICITIEFDDDQWMRDAGTSTFVGIMRAFQAALLPCPVRSWDEWDVKHLYHQKPNSPLLILCPK